MEFSGSSFSKGTISVEKALQKLKHYCGYQERSHLDVKQKLYSFSLFKKEEMIVKHKGALLMATKCGLKPYDGRALPGSIVRW